MKSKPHKEDSAKVDVPLSKDSKFMKSNKERTNGFLIFKSVNKVNPQDGKAEYDKLTDGVRFKYDRIAEVIRFVKKIEKNNDPNKIYKSIRGTVESVTTDMLSGTLHIGAFSNYNDNTKEKQSSTEEQTTLTDNFINDTSNMDVPYPYDEHLSPTEEHYPYIEHLSPTEEQTTLSDNFINDTSSMAPNMDVPYPYDEHKSSTKEQTTLSDNFINDTSSMAPNMDVPYHYDERLSPTEEQTTISDNFINGTLSMAPNMDVPYHYDERLSPTEEQTTISDNFINGTLSMAPNMDVHYPYIEHLSRTEEQTTHNFTIDKSFVVLNTCIHSHFNSTDKMIQIMNPLSLNGDNIDEELWSLRSHYQSFDEQVLEGNMDQNSNIQPMFANNMFMAESANVLDATGGQLQPSTSEIYLYYDSNNPLQIPITLLSTTTSEYNFQT
ncbi:7352_t:CDS:2 [Cetraspora pellucida]|uniref:7352_t:CDS:1 n=1 Tax=Cetraspora pellucida TaxID=1433469 RepID=A0A9N8Z3D0_9GLOM|nr:7352_t:CDS:2 [Cetraspora pellucida]